MYLDENTKLRLTTYTRLHIDVTCIEPEDISIRDIAHSLGQLCRYAGHTPEMYSVAQHSVRVAFEVARTLEEANVTEQAEWSRMVMTALLHDATEAYLADLPSPVKRLLPDYVKLEDDVWKVVAMRFNLPFKLPEIVKWADKYITEWELYEFMGFSKPHSREPALMPAGKPLKPSDDRDNFHRLFRFLRDARNV